MSFLITLLFHRYLRIPLLIGGIFLFSAQTPGTREYQIKAIFLFNFTQFIEWPSSSFPTTQSPMVIGILGKDPFGNYLEEVLSNEKVNGHALVTHHYNTIDELESDCLILYINSETPKIETVITKLKGRNILTVSEAPNFIKQGGMIRFYTKENKIQLQVNPEAAKSANLTISSKLLRLAEIVIPSTKNK
jgi:hypothetical protein